MTFTERIKQLREKRQLSHRKVAEALDIDGTAFYKIERDERKDKREQLYIIALLFNVYIDEILSLWLYYQVAAVVENDKTISNKMFDIAKNKINKL